MTLLTHAKINVKSQRSREIISRLILLFSLSFLNPLGHSAPLPDMGDPNERFFSDRQEKQLGEEFIRTIRLSLPLIDDPLSEHYIQSLGKRVAMGLQNNPSQFNFFIINATQINAFAGPGGHIGIHSGLIAIANSEDELASVLAHEIAHVTQRHLAQALKHAAGMSLPMTAAVIAAIILGKDNTQLSQAAITSAAAGSIQTQINFTRENEKEADRIGLEILAYAGFNPRAMPAFFERMQRANRSENSDAFEFLRTHPLTPSRIADTRNRAEQYPLPADSAHKRFPFIQARLMVLSSTDNEQTLLHFKQTLAQHEDVTSRYGLALALKQSGQATAALSTLQPLLKENPDSIDYLNAHAEILLAAGELTRAQTICRQALALFPHHPALTLLYAQSLVENQQAEQASNVLTNQIRYTGPTPRLYAQLAQAQEKAGHTAASYLSLAEHHLLLGDTQAALTQLKTALKHTTDHDTNLKKKIIARLERVEALQKHH